MSATNHTATLSRRPRTRVAALITAAALIVGSVGLSSNALAGAGHQAHHKGAGHDTIKPVAKSQPQPDATRERDYFTDLPLVNSDGEPMRFYSDVLKGQTVVVNFIYTTCKDACPMATQKLKQMRAMMDADMLGKVRFVSISIDPENDTPKALRKFAEKQDIPMDNWLLLTGLPEDIETIVSRLGQYTNSPEQHSTLVLAGNVDTRHWIKLPPFLAPPAMMAQMERLMMRQVSLQTLTGAR